MDAVNRRTASSKDLYQIGVIYDEVSFCKLLLALEYFENAVAPNEIVDRFDLIKRVKKKTVLSETESKK